MADDLRAEAREQVADWLQHNLFWGLDPSKKHDAADAVLALPAVQEALAAADKLEQMEALADDWDRQGHWSFARFADRLRRALAGEDR